MILEEPDLPMGNVRNSGSRLRGCVRGKACGRIILDKIPRLRGGAMKTGPVLCVVALLLLWPVAAVAQSAFEPLDRWKGAVVAGDVSQLDALYSTIPPARAETPQGATEDFGE